LNVAGTAVVVAAYGRRMLLEPADGRLIQALPRNRDIRAVCGDRVDYAVSNDSTVVTAVHARTGVLWRQDSRAGRRPVAANLDTLVIVTAPAPPVAPSQIDRYLAIAELLELRPLLVANKTDLDPVALDEFAALGYAAYATSAHTGAGVDALARALAGRRAALTGLSGVGKSALITALIPDYRVRSAALSTASGGGRHTTTAARLYPLPGGGGVIDSPGVRDIRLWPMPATDLVRGFREFRPHLGNCRFRDCRHGNEPDCALRAAVAKGEVSERRYRGYLELAERLAAT
jgi:ribosome biogenesis GTPase